MRNIAACVDDALRKRTLNRRQFCGAMAGTAAFYAAADSSANAIQALGVSPARGFKIIGINHISYACADYRKARDFYRSVLGMQEVPNANNGRETRLMFGAAPGKGGSFLIPRNARTTTNAKSRVDHISYTISDGIDAKFRTALASKGFDPSGDERNLHLHDPFDFDVQLEAAAHARGLSTESALTVSLVNHVSYTCQDVRHTADWYSTIFNLDQVHTSDAEIALPFGGKNEQPYGVIDKAVPASRLIIRSRETDGTDAAHPRKSRALINHVAYTIADFDKDHVQAELKRLGYPQPLQDGEHSFHIVDPNGFDVQISGLQMTAISG